MKKMAWILALALATAGCARREAALLCWQPVGDRWVAQRTLEDATLEADLPAVNDAVDAGNRARAEEMARAFEEEMDERRAEFPEMAGGGAWVLKGEASHLDALLTSVALTEYTYLPGNAHGAYAIETRTYWDESGADATLEALFLPGTDVYGELSRLAYWMLLDSAQMGDYADPKWIRDGTEPTADNFSAFLVRPEGLEIIFAPYQIGPWVLGEQRLVIPWSRLTPWLIPEVARAAEKAD